jgi:hypothetical protein
MKISKTAAAVLAAIIILFVATVLFLHNREIRRIEEVAVAEITAKLEREAEAKRRKDREALEAKLAEHEKAIIHKTILYEDERKESARQRAEKERARQANASIGKEWQAKFDRETEAHRLTIKEWGESEAELNRRHDEIVSEFRLTIAELQNAVGILQTEVTAGDKAIIGLKAALALEKRKAGKRIVHGPGVTITYRDGKPDATAGYQVTFRIGRIG